MTDSPFHCALVRELHAFGLGRGCRLSTTLTNLPPISMDAYMTSATTSGCLEARRFAEIAQIEDGLADLADHEAFAIRADRRTHIGAWY